MVNPGFLAYIIAIFYLKAGFQPCCPNSDYRSYLFDASIFVAMVLILNVFKAYLNGFQAVIALMSVLELTELLRERYSVIRNNESQNFSLYIEEGLNG